MKKTALILVLALVACTREDPSSPERMLPPSNVAYDPVLSSDSAISVTWDTDDAVRADALAFTVQLVLDPASDDAEFSRRIKSYEPRPCDTFRFDGLELWSRYYVRVRAEYASGVSEWAYLGEPTVVETGTGPVDGGIVWLKEPEVRTKATAAGSLAVEWSVTGFERMAADRDRDYRVAIFKDAACSSLDVAWVLKASDNVFEGVDAGLRHDPDFPSFMFTGLEPDTDYWVKVSDLTGGGSESSALRVRTEPSQVVVPGTTPVGAGEYALYEDFEELIWGGGGVTGSAGYNSLMRAALPAFVKATGENPVDTPELFFPCSQNNEYELFSNLGWLKETTRLKDWQEYGSACARACCLRAGTSSSSGGIVTPPLTNLQGSAKVEVGFDARNYYVRESRDLKIDIVGTGGAVRKAAGIQMEGGYFMQHYSVSLVDLVAPGEKIRISGDRRFYLDNVYVKILSYR